MRENLRIQGDSLRNERANFGVQHMASLSPSLMTLCHLLQMESVSPFSTLSTINVMSCECKFLGTLMFNHLPPSDHERQTSQSTSSSVRRFNRGNYHDIYEQKTQTSITVGFATVSQNWRLCWGIK